MYQDNQNKTCEWLTGSWLVGSPGSPIYYGLQRETRSDKILSSSWGFLNQTLELGHFLIHHLAATSNLHALHYCSHPHLASSSVLIPLVTSFCNPSHRHHGRLTPCGKLPSSHLNPLLQTCHSTSCIQRRARCQHKSKLRVPF